ncbi:MAG: zf-TFIIB domain-containing protein [Armatimonadetes bacterium]|nr:zf-TFIIB domain-containing protein [Armatimonadota bacterium]
METQTHLGVNLDVCPKCAGIWFDDGELRRIRKMGPDSLGALDDEVKPEIPDETQPESKRHCPNCDGPLYRYRYLYTSPIELDACRACGGCWVEDGELKKMQQFLGEEKGKPLTPEEMKRIAVAKLDMELEDRVARASSLTQLFQAFRMRVPWF